MDYNIAKQLLDKYFAGETSLAEEQQLQAYFQQDNIAEDLQAYQPLFGYFQQEKQHTTSETFNQQLAVHTIAAPKSHLQVRYRWVAAAAAIVLILGGAWHFYTPFEEVNGPTAAIDWSQFEPESEEEAIRLTKGALVRTSKAIRQGLHTATLEVENVKKIMDWE